MSTHKDTIDDYCAKQIIIMNDNFSCLDENGDFVEGYWKLRQRSSKHQLLYYVATRNFITTTIKDVFFVGKITFLLSQFQIENKNDTPQEYR